MHRRHFLAALAAAATSPLTAWSQEKKVRVAVIGHTGRGNYGHGLDTLWKALPEVEVVAVADANAQGLAAAEKRLGARGFADYRTMLAEVKPEIVAIAPRFIDEHRDMALAACAAGAQGIYLEKAFCRTPAEADEIIAACTQHGTKLAVAHRNRYHPALPAAAQAVQDGAIGRLLELRARGKEDARGGALDLWVLGSHVLNLAHYFAGAPRACSAVLLQNGRPATKADVRAGAEGHGPLAGDEVHARFEMAAGVPLFFDSKKDAGTKEANFGLQLIGTGGILDLRIDVDPLAHLLAGNPFAPGKNPLQWRPVGGTEPRVATHELAARDLLAAIRENRPPLCSAEEARVTVEMICAVFASHVRGGGRVELPLEERTHPLARW
jgi:predicted dehydrogenase